MNGSSMKVGIIGAGAVGSACAMALMQRGSAREIVLIDRTAGRARAVALDMRYGAPVSPTVDVRDGSYEDLNGADLVMITAGVNEKAAGRHGSQRCPGPAQTARCQRRRLPGDRAPGRCRRAGCA